ncbi:DUF4926 domain-containing protein [Xanthomonas campestris]|nr:DUF4926 domain-containing protein [Xanthomonas campestris]
MRISEFDIVRVIANIPDARIDHDSSQRPPQIGDLGAVVLVHAVQPGHEAAFAVECVGSEGRTIWLADISASELERAPATSAGA